MTTVALLILVPPGTTAGSIPTSYAPPFGGAVVLHHAAHYIYCGHTNMSTPIQFSLTSGLGAFRGGSHAAPCGNRALDTVNNTGSPEVGITAAIPVVFPAHSTGNISVNLGISWETGGGIKLGVGSTCHPAGFTTSRLVNASNPHWDLNSSMGACFLLAHFRAAAKAVLIDTSTGKEFPLVNRSGSSNSSELVMVELVRFSSTDSQTCYGPGNAYGHPAGCTWKNTSKLGGNVAPLLGWGTNSSSYRVFSAQFAAGGIGFHPLHNWSVVFTFGAYATSSVQNSIDGSARAWMNLSTGGHEISLVSIVVS